MVHLVDAHGPFHADVIAARLRAEGIRCEVGRSTTWPWPNHGSVAVWVAESDLDDASQVLLFDQVDAAFS